jgi:hypothetical protein
MPTFDARQSANNEDALFASCERRVQSLRLTSHFMRPAIDALRADEQTEFSVDPYLQRMMQAIGQAGR